MNEWISNFATKAKRIFLKNGKVGETLKFVDDMRMAEREHLLQKVAADSSEIPILGGSDGEYHFLLTDQRIYQLENQRRICESLANLFEVLVDLNDVKRNQSGKWDTLEFVDSLSRSTTIRVEKGPPFIGLWNILIFVAAHNRKSQKDDS